MLTYVNPQGGTSEIDFKDLLSQATYTVLYFYPKDNTPGCTIEAKDFSALQRDFKKLHTQVIGVSKDSTKSHCSFQTKQELSLGLIADPETTFIQQFGARGEKKFMGKKYMGTNRNTYLLDAKGKVMHERISVSAVGHAAEVLEFVKTL